MCLLIMALATWDLGYRVSLDGAAEQTKFAVNIQREVGFGAATSEDPQI